MSERSHHQKLPVKKGHADLFLHAVTICIGLAGFIILGTYVIEGRTNATRAATALCMPLGLLWMLLLGSLIAFCRRKRKSVFVAFTIAFVLLTVGANSIASQIFLRQIEWPEEQPTATTATPFRSVIVLGGGIGVTAAGTPEAGQDGERVISAAQLWHQGLTKSIICTGEDPGGEFHPKDLGEQMLASLGVPAEAIFRVGGENTAQEMQKLRLFFKQPQEGFPERSELGKVALITSAFHLKRAVRLAEAEGLDQQIELEPLATCFRTSTFGTISPRRLIPDADAAADFGRALKETLAKFAGR
ncbi:hypothetical protein LF1_34270 [Rubripirellula obstinata]|uniref:DUF218 domain-containing protein n=1 Tax=Rubripirellula obstinata TaxID=406547 RepID=A0A5B1CLW0_9BACT|nr:YdcF family protein [Rubripirellula obstinata]KAA1260885.1 hypothetical protein LF1_34270 [Rubripirellula obstinata]